MKIAFRVDASSQIGTGHFTRCLTLANALKQRGGQVRFISRHLPTHFRDMLEEKGHGFIMLKGISSDVVSADLAHAYWLGTSQQRDAQDSIHGLSDQTWDWLVVDHYALDHCWESELRQTAKNIFVIDDIADRRHDCDILLDQNFFADMDTRYAGKVPAHCRLLLGPRYALLRDEFRQLRQHVKTRTGSVRRVLIFFGGVDATNHTGVAVEALANIDIKELHVDVVVGAQHTHREQIAAACRAYGFDFHVQTSRMAELMAAADLSVGAGGVAIWERCCLGLPTFTLCTADNQIKQVADAASEAILYAPQMKGDLSQVISRHLAALMENDHLRQAISQRAMQFVDGRGIARVIRNMGYTGITMRVACQEDAEKLYEWRNHPTIRSVSRNSEMIHWEDHQKWLATVLTSVDRLLLIGHRFDVPVGVVRFDIQGDEAEVSIYLVPGIKELGLGGDLLRGAEHCFSVYHPGIRVFRANVLGGNEPSRHLFLGAGYQVDSTFFSKRLP